MRDREKEISNVEWVTIEGKRAGDVAVWKANRASKCCERIEFEKFN